MTRLNSFFKSFSPLILTGFIIPFSLPAFALPFNITPKAHSSLPTQIIAGQTVTALYTIANNSGSLLAGNYMKYLPPNVTQITSDNVFPGLCGSIFSLQASGHAGSSCTLELSITGIVNKNDPDPHHHLFACVAGGTTCAGTSSPLNVTNTNAPQVLVAVGDYFNGGDNPAIAVNNINGSGTWAQQVLTVPTNFNSGLLNGSSCTENFCLAVGDYFNTNGDNPAVDISTNNGVTWSQQILIVPASFSTGYFTSVNCTGNTCNAVGTYISTVFATQQFALARTTDNGNTWTQQSLPLPSGYSLGILNGISCVGNACTAVGTLRNSSFNNFAAIATSSNAGLSWSQQVLPTLNGFSDEALMGDSCVGNTCIAVGNADSNSPLVAVSTNNGTSWTQQNLNLPSGYTKGELVGVSCTDTYCVAVGDYNFATPNNQRAAIALSYDQGTTWIQQTLPLVSPYTTGFLNSVQCSGNTCIAVGNYNVSGQEAPLVVTSNDRGVSWVQQVLTPPAGGYTFSGLNGIS